MSVSAAAFNLVHDYPGGAAALAPLMGKAASMLSHEVDPNQPGFKFGLADAVKATVLARNLGVLNAFAAQVGCMVIKLPDLESASDTTLAAVSRMAQEFAQLVGEVGSAMADGTITGNELVRIQREAGQLQAAVQHVLVALTEQHSAGLPAHIPGARGY